MIVSHFHFAHQEISWAVFVLSDMYGQCTEAFLISLRTPSKKALDLKMHGQSLPSSLSWNFKAFIKCELVQTGQCRFNPVFMGEMF